MTLFRARRGLRRRAIAARSGPEANETSDQGSPPDHVAQLKQLHELREQGILSEDEFTAEKSKLLGA